MEEGKHIRCPSVFGLKEILFGDRFHENVLTFHEGIKNREMLGVHP
ncbi:MAG TPA: hypothetical protein PLN32_05255 [Methanoregulaceae archaeon]|nr:hypothetical protein [Methanoregulaceae archaeon]